MDKREPGLGGPVSKLRGCQWDGQLRLWLVSSENKGQKRKSPLTPHFPPRDLTLLTVCNCDVGKQVSASPRGAW